MGKKRTLHLRGEWSHWPVYHGGRGGLLLHLLQPCLIPSATDRLVVMEEEERKSLQKAAITAQEVVAAVVEEGEYWALAGYAP